MQVIIQGTDFFFLVLPLMRLQGALLSETLGTHVTRIRFLSRVYPLVPNDVTSMIKPFTTRSTNIGSFVGVGSIMHLQIKLLEEGFSTLRTDVVSFIQMVPIDMILKRKFSPYILQ